ncbi:MAG: hypothetical protein FWE03_02255 [Firmicutes bacterium]|nr:hypothetical protein [Bacillota bacterium]
MSNKKFAFIGDIDSTIAFKTIGADTFLANDANQTLDILKLLDENYVVCFILENLASLILDQIINLRVHSHLAIITIPSLTSKQTIDLLKKDIEQAMGSDTIFRS